MPRTLAHGPSNGEWEVFGSGSMTGLPPGAYAIEVDPHILIGGPIVGAVWGRTVSDTSIQLAPNGSDTVTITVGPAARWHSRAMGRGTQFELAIRFHPNAAVGRAGAPHANGDTEY